MLTQLLYYCITFALLLTHTSHSITPPLATPTTTRSWRANTKKSTLPTSQKKTTYPTTVVNNSDSQQQWTRQRRLLWNAADFLPCGTPMPDIVDVQTSMNYRLISEARFSRVTYFNLVFNVLMDPTVTLSNIPDIVFLKQIDKLNQIYAGLDKSNGATSNYPDTFVRWRLAGINRYSANYAFANCGTFGNGTYVIDGPVDQNIMTKYSVSGNVVNVFTCNLQDGTRTGYAHYPCDIAARRARIFMGYQFLITIPGIWDPASQSSDPGFVSMYNKGDMLAHECGHVLGLFHTFQGGCTEPNDDVLDTPEEATYYQADCPSGTTRDSCVDNPGVDPISNQMDYSSDTCRDHFTAGQADRMASETSRCIPTYMNTPVPPLVTGQIGTAQRYATCRSMTCSTTRMPNGNFPPTQAGWCYTYGMNPTIWPWGVCFGHTLSPTFYPTKLPTRMPSRRPRLPTRSPTKLGQRSPTSRPLIGWRG